MLGMLGCNYCFCQPLFDFIQVDEQKFPNVLLLITSLPGAGGKKSEKTSQESAQQANNNVGNK
jgi:hypothetical protein